MDQGYLPPSAFLKAVAAGDAPLSGGPDGEHNLRLLLTMMHDEDTANRDWATFLLAQEPLDSPAIREALLSSAADANVDVRAEALEGLARRDRSLALPLVQQALKRGEASMPVFEAATLVADQSLISDLRDFAAPSGNSLLDDCALDALRACEEARPLKPTS